MVYFILVILRGPRLRTPLLTGPGAPVYPSPDYRNGLLLTATVMIYLSDFPRPAPGLGPPWFTNDYARGPPFAKSWQPKPRVGGG